MPYFIVNRNAQPISGDNEVHNPHHRGRIHAFGREQSGSRVS